MNKVEVVKTEGQVKVKVEGLCGLVLFQSLDPRIRACEGGKGLVIEEKRVLEVSRRIPERRAYGAERGLWSIMEMAS